MNWLASGLQPVWKSTDTEEEDSLYPGVHAIYSLETTQLRQTDTSLRAIKNISFKEAKSSYASEENSKRVKVDTSVQETQPQYGVMGQFAQNGQFAASVYNTSQMNSFAMNQARQ